MNKAQSRQDYWKDFEHNQVFGKSIITFQEFHKVGVTVIMHTSVKNHVRSTPQHVCPWKSCRHVENFTSTFSHLSLAHLTALLVHVSLSRYPRLAIWFKATHRGEKLRRCCKTATLALACVRHFIHPFTQKKLPKRSPANWSCHAWPFSITLMSEEGIRREWSCPGCQPQDTVGLYCRAEPWRWGRLEAESTLAASLPRNRRVRLAWFGLVKC